MKAERTSKTLRVLMTGLIAAACALGLSGCDTFLPDPIAFTLIDGQAVVRVCIPLTVSKVLVEERKPSAQEVVWSASGSTFLPAGAEFALGQAPEGLVPTGPGTEILAHDFELSMDVSSEEGGSWTTFSSLGNEQLVEGVWLDGYGEPVETPCARGECMAMSACHNVWPAPTGYPTETRSTFVPKP